MSVVGIAVLGGLALALVTQAFAVRSAARPPTVVVTVDVGGVLKNLQQWADALVDIQAIQAEVEAQHADWNVQLDELQNELDELPETDEDARLAVFQRIEQLAANYRAWVRFSRVRLDREASLRLRDLNISIETAIKDMALVEGFDVVLHSDSEQELRVNSDANVPLEAQVLQQMTSRRVLFAAETVDITNDLVVRMNNAYDAGD